MIVMYALPSIAHLMKISYSRAVLLESKIFAILEQFVLEDSGVSFQAFITLDKITLMRDEAREAVFQKALGFVLEDNASLSFHAQNYLEKYTMKTPLRDWTLTRTRSISISQNEIRNEYWTFESFRAKYAVKEGKAAFSVKLQSAGILQIGWSTISATFDPESGTGVGDDQDSYSYDGSRCRKYHAGNTTVRLSLFNCPDFVDGLRMAMEGWRYYHLYY